MAPSHKFICVDLKVDRDPEYVPTYRRTPTEKPQSNRKYPMKVNTNVVTSSQSDKDDKLIGLKKVYF